MTDIEIAQRAKMYMDKLANGIDPITDQIIENDSVLNNVRLARCFFYISDILRQVIENGGTVSQKQSKSSFVYDSSLISKLTPSEYDIRITEFLDMLLSASGDQNVKRPSAKIFSDWLLANEFLEICTNNEGKQQRLPTLNGKQIGMYSKLTQGKYGDYAAVYYTPDAQRFLINHLDLILK